MKILVTGGRGFLGGRLLSALQHIPHIETACTTRNTGTNNSLLNTPVFSIDWPTGHGLIDACRNVDVIIHLSAMNEQDAAINHYKALEDNAIATLRLLDAAVEAGVQRFIYVSTAKVYGPHLIGSVNESTPAFPLSDYAITHKIAEDYILAYHAKKKIEGIVYRLSNGVGCPIHAAVNCWSTITNSFCKQAVVEKKITLQGTGQQWRNFIGIGEAANALIHASKISLSDINIPLFNLGDNDSMRIIDMAKLVSKRCKLKFNFMPNVTHNPHDSITNEPKLDFQIEKLTSTGFSPKFTLDIEIDSTLDLCAGAFLQS
ncbi:MAG: SDR family oxidoreductase [Methylocystaceae bacterium]|nr:SDR family oxidoreductase [Methylocystaceae bacterium]